MGDQGHFQGSPYNTPHQSRQRLSSTGSIGSQQSFHGEESPQYYPMQPVTPGYQMPLQNEMNNMQLSHSHSQQSLNQSDSSFDFDGAFDGMDEFRYTESQAPLTGDPNVLWHQQNNPNVLWNQQNDPNFQANHYPTDNYGVNQLHMSQMNPTYQHQVYDDYHDDRLESTLTYASANNAQAVTTHPQQAPMMANSNTANQETQFVYYHQTPLSNISADGFDYSSQGEGYESDTSQRSMRRERTSRPANRPYDRPASRSTSRNSNHSNASQNQHAGRGRPAVYKIDFNNLTELQEKAKKKIENSDIYRSKATEEEKYNYLLERLQNNEAVRNSRLNKSNMLGDVLSFGEELYHAAQHVRQKLPAVENEIESLLEKIERWEAANNTDFVKKVRELKPKPNADNLP